MAVVELPAADIQWPPRCCGCGGIHFAWRELRDNPTIWWTPWVRAYSNVTIPIPVCSSCWTRSRKLLAAAVVTAAIAWLVASICDLEQHHLATWCVLGWVVAAALFVRSLRAAPVRITRIDPKAGTLTLRVRRDDIATELLGHPGSTGVASETGLAGR